MADDSKEKPSADPEGNREDGDDKAVPFVPYDDSANMAAIFAAQRRLMVPDAGGLALSGETPIVLVGTATLKADAIVLPGDWVATLIRRLDAIEPASTAPYGLLRISAALPAAANTDSKKIKENRS